MNPNGSEFPTVGGKIVVTKGTSSYTMGGANDVQPNVGSRGLIAYPFVNSAGGGTVTTNIMFRDRLGNDYAILSTAATSAAGPVTPLVIYPGLLTVANQTLGYPLGGRYYLSTNVSGTITYSLSYDELP